MPATKPVLTNQVLTDISESEYSTVEGLFALAIANGIGITDEPAVGALLTIPDYTAPRQVMPSTQVPPVQVTKNPVQAMLLQTLLDLTIQETGDLGRLFDLAILNQVSPTSDLTVGGTYYSPLPVNPLKLVVLILQKVHPATGIRDIDLPLGGIGFMQIQNSFIVN